ncbi:hypothetical protein ABDK56_07595 [Sphingomonas sp. ASV193]|uniref:hypothetical protein n=1 Tax=Sphingomonas sp. ASV193 TaxID=3144405 RepID=UPI0032E8C178
MRKPTSVATLETLGRVRLSKTFFMRDMLYSEIAQIHGLVNVPDDPDLAIEAGRHLCQELLEPLQDHWGRIAIRSAYRSRLVNQLGNEKGYSCSSNEANRAGHIWDWRDENKCLGATACVVVPSFWDAYRNSGDWRIIAEWVHYNLPYSELEFFNETKRFAFNISWNEQPKRKVLSYAAPIGLWNPARDY